jgi:hypothetical protein
LHTWVFGRFRITPRLALLSPVRGCGKTSFLNPLAQLVLEGERSDDVTAASIYHQLYERPGTTLLIDEADNLNLFNNNVLRVVFNSGHDRDGNIRRFVKGRSQRFSTFAPLAVAAIGLLPLPLMAIRWRCSQAIRRCPSHGPGPTSRRGRMTAGHSQLRMPDVLAGRLIRRSICSAGSFCAHASSSIGRLELPRTCVRTATIPRT